MIHTDACCGSATGCQEACRTWPQPTPAAHTHRLIQAAAQAGLFVVADLAYASTDPAATHVLTGYRRTPGRDRSPGQKTANHALASLRARCEHPFAPFKR